MHPLISIITVTKNCASTIGRTLDSVRQIKSSEIEYIVIDGQSTDETLNIVAGYGDCVDHIVSELDTGIYNAMNKGAKIANGRYVLFLNGDDYLLPDGFNQAAKMLEEKKPEILSCSSKAIAENGSSQSLLVPIPWQLRFFNTIPHLSTFVAASLQKKYQFRERYRIAADYDLFLRLYLDGHRFVVSDSIVGVHYRGGFSGNVAQSEVEIRAIRKENLSMPTYIMANAIQSINRFRKSI